MISPPGFLFRKAPRWTYAVALLVFLGVFFLVAYLTGLLPSQNKAKKDDKRSTNPAPDPTPAPTPTPTDPPAGTEPVVPEEPEVPSSGETEKDQGEQPRWYFIGATILFLVLTAVLIAAYYIMYKNDRLIWPVSETFAAYLWLATLVAFIVALVIDLIDDPSGRDFAVYLYSVNFFLVIANCLWCAYWFTAGFQEKKGYYQQAKGGFDYLLEKYQLLDTPENRKYVQEQWKNVEAGIETLNSFYDAYQKGLLATTYGYTTSKATEIANSVGDAIKSGRPAVIVDTMKSALYDASKLSTETKQLLKDTVADKEQKEIIGKLGVQNMSSYVSPLQTPVAQYTGGEFNDGLDEVYEKLKGEVSGVFSMFSTPENPDRNEFEKEAKAYLEKEAKVLFPETEREKEKRHKAIIDAYAKDKTFK